MKYKPDLEIRDSLGWTPIIIATSSGSVEVVKELIGAGADVTAANDRDQTALHYAARSVGKQFVAGGCTSQLTDHCLAASSKGYAEIGKLLIEKGADINARDKANQLPL